MNVTKIMFMLLFTKSEHLTAMGFSDAEAILGKIFDIVGISLDKCAENDCLNPCSTGTGNCLACFADLFYDY